MWRKCISRRAGVAAPAVSVRSILLRDLRTSVEISKGEMKYPAVLLWRWKSNRQKHLVLSVQAPDGTEGESSAEPNSKLLPVSAPTPADYFFGRVFLRPYNVAQLLAVLEGKAPHVELIREHASLYLGPVAIPSSGDSGHRCAKGANGALTALPSAYSLAGKLTVKVQTNNQSASVDDELPQDDDYENDEGRAGATYKLDDRRNFRATVKGEDLIFIMKHLDAVLGDMFGIEHQYHSRVALEILQKHRLGGIQSYNRNNGSQLQPVPRYRSESLYTTKAQTLSEDSATTTPMATPSSVAPKPTKGGDNSVGDLSFAAAPGLAGVALGAAATPLFSKGTSVIEPEDVNEDSVDLREVEEEVDIPYDSTHSPATPAARFVDHDEKHDDEEEDFNEDKAGELKEFEKEDPEEGVAQANGEHGKENEHGDENESEGDDVDNDEEDDEDNDDEDDDDEDNDHEG
ncbi:hypothetical protein ECC02_007536 [Trypanosoma cruzi]|uniref:Uncharacterized protein n=1 Tax=Trypanosoma cruzi TaxID=5693 RepID=A0A7J6XYA0_TRYCR|nr:hypothetical protein ECC02_007536 [Trypanosoma cruzi]